MDVIQLSFTKDFITVTHNIPISKLGYCTSGKQKLNMHQQCALTKKQQHSQEMKARYIPSLLTSRQLKYRLQFCVPQYKKYINQLKQV